jgi:hypothetical protein
VVWNADVEIVALLLPPPAQSTQEPHPREPLSVAVESSILRYFVTERAAPEKNNTIHAVTHTYLILNMKILCLGKFGDVLPS